MLEFDTPDLKRKEKADLSAPIMVAKDKQGRMTVIDGLHRLAKAVDENVDKLKGFFITNKELKNLEIALDEKNKQKKTLCFKDWFRMKK